MTFLKRGGDGCGQSAQHITVLLDCRANGRLIGRHISVTAVMASDQTQQGQHHEAIQRFHTLRVSAIGSAVKAAHRA
jgi:hypothetical protein